MLTQFTQLLDKPKELICEVMKWAPRANYCHEYIGVCGVCSGRRTIGLHTGNRLPLCYTCSQYCELGPTYREHNLVAQIGAFERALAEFHPAIELQRDQCRLAVASAGILTPGPAAKIISPPKCCDICHGAMAAFRREYVFDYGYNILTVFQCESCTQHIVNYEKNLYANITLMRSLAPVHDCYIAIARTLIRLLAIY